MVDDRLNEFSGAKAAIKAKGYGVNSLPPGGSRLKRAVAIVPRFAHDPSVVLASPKRKRIGAAIKRHAKNLPDLKAGHIPQVW